MSKHTLGPWRNVIGYDGSCTILAGRDYNLECIALIKSTLCCQADARIIAAAPELLEALEFMVAMFANSIQIDGYVGPAINQARAAIAKAKGEQP